jgi:hypothetical protein
MTEREVTRFDQDEMVAILPVILSDLKQANVEAGRVASNTNIRRGLYFYVIRELYSENRFEHQESVDLKRGLFIKGYVRDVWTYLETAYDLIHRTNFEVEYAQLISDAD